MGGAIPGFQVFTTIAVNSLLSGSANAFLTLRVGMIAKAYCGSLVAQPRTQAAALGDRRSRPAPLRDRQGERGARPRRDLARGQAEAAPALAVAQGPARDRLTGRAVQRRSLGPESAAIDVSTGSRDRPIADETVREYQDISRDFALSRNRETSIILENGWKPIECLS